MKNKWKIIAIVLNFGVGTCLFILYLINTGFFEVTRQDPVAVAVVDDNGNNENNGNAGNVNTKNILPKADDYYENTNHEDNSWLIGSYESVIITNAKNFGTNIDYMEYDITIMNESKLHMALLTKLTPSGLLNYQRQNPYSGSNDLKFAEQVYDYTVDNERNAIYCGPYDSSNPIYFNKERQILIIDGKETKKKPSTPKKEPEKEPEFTYIDNYEKIIILATKATNARNYKPPGTNFSFTRDKKDNNILLMLINNVGSKKYLIPIRFRGFQSKTITLYKEYPGRETRYAVFSASVDDKKIKCYMHTTESRFSAFFQMYIEGWTKDILYAYEEFEDFTHSLRDSLENNTKKNANDYINLDGSEEYNDIKYSLDSITINNPNNDLSRSKEAENENITRQNNEKTEIFSKVDVPPSFPGGETALMKFLTDNMTYPTNAADQGIQGRVILRFVVNSDGSISDIEVSRSLEKSCDNEAIRVIKLMPKWIPGKLGGVNVPVYYTLPIVYRLQND